MVMGFSSSVEEGWADRREPRSRPHHGGRAGVAEGWGPHTAAHENRAASGLPLCPPADQRRREGRGRQREEQKNRENK